MTIFLAAGESAGPCDVVRWDASMLPLRTASIDRVICDMPFGNRCGNCLCIPLLLQEHHGQTKAGHCDSVCIHLEGATESRDQTCTTFGNFAGNHKVREVLCPRVVKQVGLVFTWIPQ